MSQLKQVALVNDFELVLRGLAGMLDPFRDRLRVVELDSIAIRDAGSTSRCSTPTGIHTTGSTGCAQLADDPGVGSVVVYTWAITNEQVDAVDRGRRGGVAREVGVGRSARPRVASRSTGARWS